jgi:hypothetical protein
LISCRSLCFQIVSSNFIVRVPIRRLIVTSRR